jgi:hypothetical protein
MMAGTAGHRQIEVVASQILANMGRAGVTARLFGGIAIGLISPWKPIFGYDRPQKDIDVIVQHRHLDAAVDVLAGQGWQIDRHSLYFNEARRVRAKHPQLGLRLDLFTDPLHLNQMIFIGHRFSLSPVTLATSDLLLTKLQAAKPTQRDLDDVIALVSTLSIGKSDSPGRIDSNRLREACTYSWGFYHGARLNLARIGELVRADARLAESTKNLVQPRIHELLEATEPSRKTLAWTIRGLLGPRFGWYEDLE